MAFDNLQRQSPGAEIQARTINGAIDAAEWATRLLGGAPFDVKSTPAGPHLRYAGAVFSAHVGITSSTIAPRSGSSPGSGTVTLQTWDGSDAAPLAGVPDVTAFNISAAGGGIPSGKWCVLLRVAGSWFIITAEC